MMLPSRIEKLEREVSELKKQLRKLGKDIPKHVVRAMELNRSGLATKTRKALNLG